MQTSSRVENHAIARKECNVASCKVCNLPDRDKPMCFRETDWCSDIHRKMLIGELPWDLNPRGSEKGLFFGTSTQEDG